MLSAKQAAAGTIFITLTRAIPATFRSRSERTILTLIKFHFLIA